MKRDSLESLKTSARPGAPACGRESLFWVFFRTFHNENQSKRYISKDIYIYQKRPHNRGVWAPLEASRSRVGAERTAHVRQTQREISREREKEESLCKKANASHKLARVSNRRAKSRENDLTPASRKESINKKCLFFFPSSPRDGRVCCKGTSARSRWWCSRPRRAASLSSRQSLPSSAAACEAMSRIRRWRTHV